MRYIVFVNVPTKIEVEASNEEEAKKDSLWQLSSNKPDKVSRLYKNRCSNRGKCVMMHQVIVPVEEVANALNRAYQIMAVENEKRF